MEKTSEWDTLEQFFSSDRKIKEIKTTLMLVHELQSWNWAVISLV